MKYGTCVFYGDSNTWGFDPCSMTGEPYPADVRWVDRAASELGCQVENAGVNGRSLPRTRSDELVLEMFIRRIMKMPRPVGLFIMLGTNDFLNEPGIRAESVAQRMADLIEKVQHIASQVKEPQSEIKPIEKAMNLISQAEKPEQGALQIIIMAPPIMKMGSWTSENEAIISESARYPACLADVAKRYHLTLIDCSSWPVTLCYDGVHLTEEGHRVMGEKLSAYLLNDSA